MDPQLTSLYSNQKDGHFYFAVRLEPGETLEHIWLLHLAQKYKDLRCFAPDELDDISFSNLDFNVEWVRDRIRQASIPQRRPGNNFDIVRSDFGEVLLYELLEKYSGTKFIYKSVRDREIAQLPGRGIDAIGIEFDVVEQGAIKLVVAEAKVSAEERNPPGVVDASSDSLSRQHRAHLDDLAGTINQVWNVAKRATDDRDIQLQYFRAAFLLEDERWDEIELVVASLLVRPERIYTENDFGSFLSNPITYTPAKIRFLIACIDDDIEPFIDRWYEIIQRKDDRS